MPSNAGFLGLQNVFGVFLILFSALLFIGIIFVGAKLVKAKEASDKAMRAELRKRVEAEKANTAPPA
jgi:hypothetical protein